MARGPKPDARAVELKAELEQALARDRLPRALELAKQLEALEPAEGRWAQKIGEIHRRAGHPGEAAAALERAARIWAAQGFVARAIAMAKTVVAIDPARRAVLDELDPGAAQREHRRHRPAASTVHEVPLTLAEAAPDLTPEAGAADDEVRFAPAPPERSIVIDLSELALLEAAAAAPAPKAYVPPPPPPPRPPPVPDDVPAEEAAPPPDEEPVAIFEEEPIEIDRLAVLPGFPLFAELPQPALVRLAEGAELVEAADGERVIRRGDPADALYAIVSGAARADVPGRPILREGDVFGESCLAEGATRSADVLAHGALLALRFPRALLDEITPHAPALERVLAEILARRVLANALATSPLFRHLPAADHREIGLLFDLRRAPPRLPLLSRGKTCDALYVVLSGELELELEGGELRRAGAGAIVGQRSVLARSKSDVTARAPRGALVLRLAATRLAAHLAQHPLLAADLAEREAATDAADETVASGL